MVNKKQFTEPFSLMHESMLLAFHLQYIKLFWLEKQAKQLKHSCFTSWEFCLQNWLFAVAMTYSAAHFQNL